MGSYNYQVLGWPAQPRSKKRREANIAGGSSISGGGVGMADLDLSGYIRIADLIKTTSEASVSEYLDTNAMSSLMVKTLLDQKANTIHDHRSQLIRPAVFIAPTHSPASAGFSLDENEVALWIDTTGNYAESISGGGSVANVYDLTLVKGNTQLGKFQPAVAAKTIDIASAFSGYATQDWVSSHFNNYSLPKASANTLGGIKVGNGLTIDNNGVLTPYVVEDSMLVLANDGTLGVNVEQLLLVTQNVVEGYGYTQKTQAIPYIVGPSSDAAGVWTGSCDGITAYADGLTIIYVPGKAGKSAGVTLNINGLGAMPCYRTATGAITTQYAVGEPILLTYRTYSGSGRWMRADYDSNTNTQIRVYRQTTGYNDDYPIIVSRTKVIGTSGSDGSYTAVYGVIGDSNIPTINPSTGLLKATTFQGALDWSYITNKPTLGTAAPLDSTSSITSGGTGLPTARAVYTYVNNAITAAQPYKGVSTTAITDGGTEMPTISGYTTRTKGDVVAYNKKEFIWEGTAWRELGDEGSYALKTTSVIAGTGLTGGGQISQDVTLSLSAASIASLGKADTAYQKPSGGIPKTDLASGVQTSLVNADSALQSGDMKNLTLKVGTSTVQADYNALTAKTYTISKQNLTDTIGSTTYAPYNADGYVPTTRTVNGHALSSDVAVTKGDVGLGNVENTALSTWTGTNKITTIGTITTGTWQGTAITNSYLANSSVTINSKNLSLGGSLTLKLSDLTDDILSGHYLPLSGGTLTGALNGTSASFSGNISATGHIMSDATISAEGVIATASDFNADGDVYATNIMPNDDSGCLGGQGQGYEWAEIWGNGIHAYTLQTTIAEVSGNLAIPTETPTRPTSGKIYLYASSLGEYAVEPWYGFNQLISNGNMESTTGWGTVYSGYTRTVENNVLILTITSATYRPQVRTALSVANGHWVYYTYTMKYTTSAAYSDVKTAFLYPTPLYIPTGNQKDADYYNWKKTSGIVKVNAAKTYLYIGRTASSSHTFAVGDTVQIKNVMVCDLTEMFGENIPTVEQFEAMYPQDYYEYTPIGG